MLTIILIILILAMIGAFPMGASYNANWGYFPSGGLGIIVVILVVLIATGRI